MTKGAVIIGVNKTGDLPLLSGCASGAEEIGRWAADQGFLVETLTDRAGPVTLGGVKTAVGRIVGSGTCEQLLVFFAGHGILRAPEAEQWLLSGAPDDPNEAVNVFHSIWLSRNVGIPHVVFVSDACRSRPTSARLSQVTGGVIFPNEDPHPPRPAVDRFYATLPGDPAYEVPVEEAVARYRGIFTTTLLNGLMGRVPDIIEARIERSGTRLVVPSWTLKVHLEKQVIDDAADARVDGRQSADAYVESHAPSFLSDVTRYQPLPIDGFRESQPVPVPGGPVAKRSTEIAEISSLGTLATLDGFRRGAVMRRNAQHILDARARTGLQIRTGFSVFGAGVQQVVIQPSFRCEVLREGALVVHVQVHGRGGRYPRSALLRMSDGIAACVAVLPGFVGTILLENGVVVSVSYSPAQDGPRSEALPVTPEVEQRRATIAALSREGLFQMSPEDSRKFADYIRVGKAVDPTFGIYAAYAYGRAGDRDGVASVFDYMRSEPEPVPFDVALLAGRLKGLPAKRLAPAVPMMTQGWSLLETTAYDPAVQEAKRNLIPSLWTTLSAVGADALAEAITRGRLK